MNDKLSLQILNFLNISDDWLEKNVLKLKLKKR